jgi:hypothetical protein
MKDLLQNIGVFAFFRVFINFGAQAKKTPRYTGITIMPATSHIGKRAAR